MIQKQQINGVATISQLDRFTLGFEYDKTIQQVKSEMRVRTF